MRGEFIAVWEESWPNIWQELSVHEAAPKDLFSDLYRELSKALKTPLKAERLAEIVGDSALSRESFAGTRVGDLGGERSVVAFLEAAYSTVDESAGESLSNYYFNLLSDFIEKFSLRYDLRRPCVLCPTLPGVFASLLRDIRILTSRDAHLAGLMRDFEDAIRDLRTDCSDCRIKTCIQKQVNLLEAISKSCPGVTKTTLGAICDQVKTWPHQEVKEAMKSLYGFASDYPGIRHGGTPAHAMRAIDMRDMVAMSILLAGFVPYLSDQVDAEIVYRGAR